MVPKVLFLTASSFKISILNKDCVALLKVSPMLVLTSVAQQTLISVAEEVNTRLDRIAAKSKINRKKLFTMDYDFGVLKNSGCRRACGARRGRRPTGDEET